MRIGSLSDMITHGMSYSLQMSITNIVATMVAKNFLSKGKKLAYFVTFSLAFGSSVIKFMATSSQIAIGMCSGCNKSAKFWLLNFACWQIGHFLWNLICPSSCWDKNIKSLLILMFNELHHELQLVLNVM